jgi:hypothetical protein
MGVVAKSRGSRWCTRNVHSELLGWPARFRTGDRQVVRTAGDRLLNRRGSFHSTISSGSDHPRLDEPQLLGCAYQELPRSLHLIFSELNPEAACLANIGARHVLATDEGVEKGPDNDECIPT